MQNILHNIAQKRPELSLESFVPSGSLKFFHCLSPNSWGQRIHISDIFAGPGAEEVVIVKILGMRSRAPFWERGLLKLSKLLTFFLMHLKIFYRRGVRGEFEAFSNE